MSQSNSENPYEPPDTVNDGGFKLRPTRAMAVFIQLGLTWLPWLWTSVKAVNVSGRGWHAQIPIPTIMLNLLLALLIAKRWRVRVRHVNGITFGLAVMIPFLRGSLVDYRIVYVPNRTWATYFLEPASIDFTLWTMVISLPTTLWLLVVRLPDGEPDKVVVDRDGRQV